MSAFSNRQTHTVCSEQGLSGEEGGLQHVCRLHDQHVLQPAQVLKLQSLVGLNGQSRRHVIKLQREIKEEKGGMKTTDRGSHGQKEKESVEKVFEQKQEKSEIEICLRK